MRSIKNWSDGLTFMLALCVVMGALLTSGCSQGGDDAAIAAPAANNPGVPGEFSGVTQNWDKNLPSGSRFTVLAAFNNQAVRDNNTGLVWEQSPDATGTYVWGAATKYCANKSSIGQTRGWRLPSVAELASLIDPSLAPPFVPAGVFTGVLQAGYWSASVDADNPTRAWFVSFFQAQADTNVKTATGTFHAWCVRGPMQESAY
jgi:hypothetical protein